jgi:protein-S-isoprenylcysteine O-methyltransferase Ste14
MEFTLQHVVAVLLWILWCFSHSFLIAAPVTDYLKEQVGDWYRYYRLIYNVVALIALAPVVIYSISIETVPVFRWEGALAMGRYMLVLAAAFLFIAGARHYRLSKVVGIDQIRTGKTSHLLTERDALSTSGILGIIRHPWYTGALLIVWSREIGLVSLSTNIVLSLYLVIGAFLEERKLLREFGDAYRQYQNRVSMLFPWKWIKLKLAEKK